MPPVDLDGLTDPKACFLYWFGCCIQLPLLPYFLYGFTHIFLVFRSKRKFLKIKVDGWGRIAGKVFLHIFLHPGLGLSPDLYCILQTGIPAKVIPFLSECYFSLKFPVFQSNTTNTCIR